MTTEDLGEPDLPLEPSSKRRFAARRVRGYLVLGPVPPRSRWLEPIGRVMLALMLPFWIYTPAFALCVLVMNGPGPDVEVMLPILFAFAAVALAAGVYPLATWPCRWPFRFVATFVWAAFLGAISFPWTNMIAEYVD